MGCTGATDRTEHVADILLKTGAALEDVFQYYKFGRYGHSFAGKPYFLLSHCTHLLFSLWLAQEDGHSGVFRRTPGPAAFGTGLDFGPLRYVDYSRRMLHTDNLEDHLKDEPVWFEFWLKLLERLEPREAPSCQEFSHRVLTCTGHRGFLEGKAVRRNEKDLDQLMTTDGAGRVLSRTMSVLDDAIQAMARHFAARDSKPCTCGQVAALLGLLSQMRRTILYETPARGPCVPRSAGNWKRPWSLARLWLRDSEGVLTVVPRREGGEIVCACKAVSGSVNRSQSWRVKAAALKNTYEQELFATWSPETGEYLRDPGRFPDTRACWMLQSTEAGRLESVSKQVEAVLDALRANPSCRGLVGALVPLVRGTGPRWKSAELAWPYLKQLDRLLGKLTFVCREAKALGGENPMEQVVSRIWPVPTSVSPARPPGQAGSPRRTASVVRPFSGPAPAREHALSARPNEECAAGVPSQTQRLPESLPRVEGLPPLNPGQDLPRTDRGDTSDATEPAARQTQVPDDPVTAAAPTQVPQSTTPEKAQHRERTQDARLVHAARWLEVIMHGPAISIPHEGDRRSESRVLDAAHEEPSSATDDPLLQRLLDRHRCPGTTTRQERFSAVQLQGELGWSRARLHQAMMDLFGPRPFDVYRKKCRDGSIGDFLAERTAAAETEDLVPLPTASVPERRDS